jgi:predicted lysophospholipase L1 biosynthesis ABC-type transport system permease subunit
VGVIADKRHAGLHDEPEPELYIPLAQFPRAPGWIVMRTEGPPLATLPAAERILRDLDPHLPATRAGTLESQVVTAMAPERFRASLATALGLAAALLAALGLYGVLTHAVAARTRELGLRMALGATAGRVQRAIVSEALRLTALGVAAGVAGAFLVADWLQAFLPPGLEARDPFAVSAAAAALVVLAVLAAWLPARRASRVDPIVALGSE